MRTCPKCLTENMDTEKVCKHCAAPLQQSVGKTCPNGHPMDPTLKECPYCGQGKAASMVAGPVPPGRTTTVFEPARSDGQAPLRRATMMEDFSGRVPLPRRGNGPASTPPSAAPQNPKRQPEGTIFRPASTPSPSVPPVAKDRKIVGILISYSWAPEGKIFPVFEGRNFIGRDKDCEISVPEDETMSGRNSHVTYRQNFVVGDMVSMTGTDLDGVPIEEQFHSLRNYATIRAGSTYFTFIAIKPLAAPGGSENSS